jgi:uncharacterized protein (DUF885 family)
MSVVFLATASGFAGLSEDLAKLCDRYWQGYLQANPTTATGLGDKRYDDRLDDISPTGIAKERKRLEGVAAAARGIVPEKLSQADRLTREALIQEVEGQLAWYGCGFEQWVVDPLGGPQVQLMNLPDYTTIDTPKDAAAYVKRVRAMGPYLNEHVANLRDGLSQRKTASVDAVLKTIDELTQLTSVPTESLAVWKPVRATHEKWLPADRDRFASDLREAIETSLSLASCAIATCSRVRCSRPRVRPRRPVSPPFPAVWSATRR